MKKFLSLLAIVCLIPFIGQAQVLSHGYVGGTSTSHAEVSNQSCAETNGANSFSAGVAEAIQNQVQIDEAQKLEQFMASRKAATEFSLLAAPEIIGEAYSVNPMKGEDSEALICFNMNLHHFNINDPTSAVSYNVAAPEFVNSADYLDGMYYLATSISRLFMTADPETGAYTIVSSNNPYGFVALGPDNQLYGLTAGSNAILYTVDITTGAAEEVVPLGSTHNMLGFTIDNVGRVFVIDSDLGGISEFDIETGELLNSLSAGFMVNYGQDLATDFATNEIYWAAVNANTQPPQPQLYKVNFDEGSLDFIGVFPMQASGFAIRTQSNFSVPVAPTNFVATPVGEELLVELSWTNPTTTMGGDDLTDLQIILLRDGEVIEEFNQAEIGADMTYTDGDIPFGGAYRYAIVAANSYGEGGGTSTSVLVGPTCIYTLYGEDAYGDGWNGAAVLFENEAGETIASATLVSGASGTVEVSLPTGLINLVWQRGPYDAECSFEIYYPWGDLMVSYPSAPSGLFYTWENICEPPTCPRPSDLVVSDVSEYQATLAWTENGTATTWEIEYGPIDFEQGEGTIIEIDENPIAITNLEDGTYYTAYVRAICGTDNVSDWSTPMIFATAIACDEGLNPLSITIGDGTIGSYTLPMNTFYNYSYAQELYTAEELIAQGTFLGEIHTIAFEHYGDRVTDIDLRIMMSNVELDDLSTGWYINENNMQLVYDGVINLEQGSGYNLEIQLQTPFSYDGYSDLLVTFIYGRNPYIGPNPRFYTHATGKIMALRTQKDDSPYELYSPTQAMGETQRNNIKFGMCISVPEYITVNGTVTSSLDNAPIADAILQFSGALGTTVTTDANGEYSVELVQLFDYDVNITANGFNTYTESFAAPAQATFEKNFVINQPTIAFNLEEIDVEAYYMQYVTQEVTITNNGTGELTWNASCIIDDAERNPQSTAHIAINKDIYNLSLEDATSTPAGFSHSEFLNSAVYVNGITYFASSSSGMFGVIDYEAGTIETIASGLNIGAVSFNPYDGEIYVAPLNGDALFSTINPVTAEMFPVFTAGYNYILGFTFSPDGTLYVIDSDYNGISTVDPTTGEFTLVFPVDFFVNYGQDVEWDFEDNILYWSAFNATIGQGQLYAIDIEENEMTMIGTLASQSSALVIETMAGAGPWLKVEPKNGVVAAGETSSFTVTMDGWHAEEGVLTGSVEVVSNTLESLSLIPVSFTINTPACDPPTDLAGEIIDFNNISLTWAGTPDAIAYNLYYGENREPFAVVEDTFYLDENLEPNIYTYKVRAIYEDGCVSVATEAVTFETAHPYRVIEGIVTSTMNQSPIEGATITFEGITYDGPKTVIATSATDGTYSADVFVGEYQVTVVAAGFNTYYIENLVVNEEGFELNFPMEQPTIELSDLEVVIETSYMNQGVHEMTITNSGTGELSWSVNVETEDFEKSTSSIAHIAINTDVYNFTLGDPSSAVYAGFSHSEFLNSAVYVDGVTYFATSTSGMFGIIDYEAGTIETIASGLGICGVSYNPADGEVYVSTLGQGALFFTIDPATAEMTYIFTAASNFIFGFTFSPEGVLYAIDAESNSISLLNPETGVYSPVWNCGFKINYGQDVEWDFEDNLLYWAAWNDDIYEAQLYVVDVEAGEGTMIGVFAEQASALVIETVSSSWLVAEPREGSVPAGGTGSFQLIADGWLAESGTFNAVATVNSNALESSIAVPVTFVINTILCDPVTNPAIEVVDFNNVVISWSIPEGGDADVVEYGIYYGDDKVPFATVDKTTLQYIDENKEPGDYSYRVRAIYEDGCVSISNVLLECTTSEALATVFGTVTDAHTGETIAGAIVKFSQEYVTSTDENGEYILDLVAGVYENVRISAMEYNSLVVESIYVDVYDNQIDFELVSEHAPVENLIGTFANGVVTLTWDAPITYKGAKDIVLYEGFDGDVTPDEWTKIDADGDNHNWGTQAENAVIGSPYAGESCMTSASYDNGSYMPLTPDNWLISPAIPINGGTLTYYVGAQDASYPADHYGVYYSVDGGVTFELLFEETLTAKSEGSVKFNGIGKNGGAKQGAWYERIIELDISSDDVYIAFRHFDCTDAFIMLLDEVTVTTSIPSAHVYKVERDGEMLAVLGAEELSYVDDTVEEGVYNYCVTVTYDDNVSSIPSCVDVEAGSISLLGDANGDGLVNVSDITAMVAYIFYLEPPTFIFANADVNGDGVINVGDIAGVVYIIYGSKISCEVANVQYQISNGVLYMNNDASVSAFQIALSNSNVKALAFDEFITATGTTEDGYIFLAYNLEGKVFEAGTHALFQVNDAEVNYFLTSTACGDVAEGRDGAFLGIDDNNLSTAYPNPFSTYVTVSNSVNAEFIVTNITGQVVYNETTSSNFVWTPSNVESGVYFINVYVDGVNVQTSKVVYQK